MLKKNQTAIDKQAILCIDDSLDVLLNLSEILKPIIEPDYILITANNLHKALLSLAEFAKNGIEVVLIIGDLLSPTSFKPLNLEDFDGTELLRFIDRVYPKALKILLTDSTEDVIEAIDRINLYGYIVKPWDETDLFLTVKEALNTYNRYFLTEEKSLRDSLDELIIQCSNRETLIENISYGLLTARENIDYKFAILFVDLDLATLVGKDVGDRLEEEFSIAICKRLERCLREEDTIARINRDCFAVLLKNLQESQNAVLVAERILNSLFIPFNFQGKNLFANPSIGIVVSSPLYQNPEELLDDGKIAMKQAKDTGKSCYAIFDRELNVQNLHNLELESDLRQAIAYEEFLMYYQPIVHLNTLKTIGFESLLCWEHPQKGLLASNEFIPLAEETGLIIPLGEWVFREACRQFRLCQLNFPEFSNAIVSVNIVSQQLWSANFVERLTTILEETNLDGKYLQIEIGEDILGSSLENILEIFNQIQDRGIQISIDDFGKGHSSIGYLTYLPIDRLKIHRLFVERMTQDSKNLDTVRALVSLGNTLDIKIIAEGIETNEQLAQLQQLGCHYGQGCLFSEPLTISQLEAYLTEENIKY